MRYFYITLFGCLIISAPRTSYGSDDLETGKPKNACKTVEDCTVIECGCDWVVLGKEDEKRIKLCADFTKVADCLEPGKKLQAACIENTCKMRPKN